MVRDRAPYLDHRISARRPRALIAIGLFWLGAALFPVLVGLIVDRSGVLGGAWMLAGLAAVWGLDGAAALLKTQRVLNTTETLVIHQLDARLREVYRLQQSLLAEH